MAQRRMTSANTTLALPPLSVVDWIRQPRLQTVSPPAFRSLHTASALVAEKKKDFATAEREFRAAVSVAGHADAWTDLGDYYSRRGQNEQAVAALHRALEANGAKDASLVDIASILYTMHREPQMA